MTRLNSSDCSSRHSCQECARTSHHRRQLVRIGVLFILFYNCFYTFCFRNALRPRFTVVDSYNSPFFLFFCCCYFFVKKKLGHSYMPRNPFEPDSTRFATFKLEPTVTTFAVCSFVLFFLVIFFRHFLLSFLLSDLFFFLFFFSFFSSSFFFLPHHPFTLP